MLSVVIPTIGRWTVTRAIESVLSQGGNCIVVNDGVDMTEPPAHPRLKYIRLGHNYGRMDGKLWYGQVAFTVGVLLSETEFTMGLGDDDELVSDIAGPLCQRIESEPSVDIWVPGIHYNNGHMACMTPGALQRGNISHTIYRTKILGYLPMYNRQLEDPSCHDWYHVQRCVRDGWKIDWIGFPCVRIRPQVPGYNGRGTDDADTRVVSPG